jgi:type I restriction enzyme S subunit
MKTAKTDMQRFSGEWETKQLKELGQFSKGRGIKRDDVTDEGAPCVRYGELYTQYQDYILKVASRIPQDVAATALPIKKGDLLFAGSGETAEEIGRCAAYLGEEQAYAGGDVIVLTPSGQNSIYLGHLMNSPIVSAQKARLGQGDAVVHIYINNLAQVQIELPPIAEQNAIAEVLSDVDRLLNSLEALIAKKRAIKQAVMQQLLTGRTRLPGFSGEWQEMRVGDLFDATAGGDLVQSRYSDVQDNHYPYPIYANGLEQQGLYGFSNYAEEPAGVITVTARGTLGQAFYRDTPFVAIGRLLVLKPKVSLDARFFCEYINFGIHFAVESTGVPQLTAPQVSRYLLPVPSESEQRAIASVLSDMDAEIAALEQRRDKTRAIKLGMMQQLLTGRVRLSESQIGTDDAD